MEARPWMTKPEDAIALATRIAQGQISARQVMAETVSRVQQLNPSLNAVCLLDAELGLRGATKADAQVAACRNDAERAALHAQQPFLGVPLLVKDLGTAATDLPSRMGSRCVPRLRGPLGAGVHWPVDSTLVARYRQAGFIPFGRSTSPEMASAPAP